MPQHRQDSDAIIQRWNTFLYYKRYQHIVSSVKRSWGFCLQIWRRLMTPSHVTNYGKRQYRNQIYQQIQYRLYVTCILIVCVLSMTSYVIHITNIQLIWVLSREMEPLQNCLFCFLIVYTHTCFNIIRPEVLIPSSKIPILLLLYKYSCLLMLMIQFYLLPHLRSYRHCCIAYRCSVLIIR